MKNVLVTSGEPRMAYAICKTLHKHGFRVYSGDVSKLSMASFSRYCAGSMTYTPPRKDKERFIRDIEEFIEKKQIDILLPTMEEIFVLAEHAERLRPKVKFILPGYEQMLLAHNKKTITAIAGDIGVAVPETWEATELLEDEDKLARLAFPVIIKPKQGRGGWGTVQFNTAPDLLQALKTTVNLQEYMVQQFIDGDVVAACAIYKDGVCIARDSYIPLAVYPLHVGQPTIRESRHFEETLNSLTKLLDHIQWNGVCEIDFIIDRTSGVSYLLDVNPRFWASIAHNIAAGVNYPYYYCQLAEGNDNVQAPDAVAGTRTRWLAGDMQRIAAEFFASDRKLRYLKEWLTTRKNFTAYDDWDITDPLPFLCWWVKAVQRKINNSLKRNS